MPKPVSYNSTLTERIDLTAELAIFKVRPDEGFEPFVPGQYMTIGLNNVAQPELGSVRRPMSIASAPEELDVLEFYIRFVSRPESSNPLTHLLWRTKAGDRLFLRNKAIGHFTLPHTIGTDDRRIKVLVAAGTGLAPFISMARSEILRNENVDLGEYVILHGASYPADLGYLDELEDMRARGLHYYPTVSRPAESPDWDGDSGRVEDYFAAGRPNRLEQLDERLAVRLSPEHAVIYICGLQGTIGSTIIRLLERGFVPDNKKLRRALEVPEGVASSLFFEQYDSTPVIDIKDPDVIDPLRAKLASVLDR